MMKDRTLLYFMNENNEEKMNIYVDNEYKFSMTLDAFLNFKIRTQ